MAEQEVARAAAPLLRLDSISKSFGPVQALCGVSLDVRAGEVLALIGENGAGKSTLMKVLSGAHRPDAGSVEMDGQPLALNSPITARRAGIAMIYQELTLAPHLTVEENVTLGLEDSRFGFMRPHTEEVAGALSLLGHSDISPEQKVGTLTIARQQIVEIARAIVCDARVVIMDEPTSSLSDEDKQALFKVINRLRGEGLAVIYISHFLDEVAEIADRYTVLRDGGSVGSGLVADTDTKALVELMIGRALSDMYPRPTHEPGEVILRADGIHGREMPSGASIELHRGEIVGIFGLVGAGRTEFARCVFGLDLLGSGTVTLQDGSRIRAHGHSPVRALAGGLDYLSENRKDEGLAQGMTIAANTTLSAVNRNSRFGFINLQREEHGADRWAQKLRVRCAGTRQLVGALSGGNQQKVAIARMLHHDSDIFVMDEPTRGIDIGSKHEIYEIIHSLAESGKGVVVISSYLPELLGTCHSLAVMHRGALSEKRVVSDWAEHDIMVYATTGKLPTT